MDTARTLKWWEAEIQTSGRERQILVFFSHDNELEERENVAVNVSPTQKLHTSNPGKGKRKQ